MSKTIKTILLGELRKKESKARRIAWELKKVQKEIDELKREIEKQT